MLAGNSEQQGLYKIQPFQQSLVLGLLLKTLHSHLHDDRSPHAHGASKGSQAFLAVYYGPQVSSVYCQAA